MSTIFTTERLVIRSFVGEDAEAMFAIQSQPAVMAMTDGQPRTSIEDVRARLLRNCAHDRPLGRWAVVDKSSGALLGGASLIKAPDAAGSPSEDVSIGLHLDPAQWGRGLASEISRGILDYGFVSVGLERILGLSHPNNTSIHAIERRLGMTILGLTRDYYRGAELHMSEITRAQWLAVR